MTWSVDEARLPARGADFLSTVFCVGNGRSCTRGTCSEERFEAFRGVYLSGLYTRAGYGLVYPMGAPDWLPAFVRVNGRRAAVRISRRVLDLREGVLRREAELETGGVRVAIVEERFAALDRPALVCQRYQVRRLAGRAPLEIVVGLDGEVRNHRAKYYKPGQLPNCDEAGLKLSEIEALVAGGRIGRAPPPALSRKGKRANPGSPERTDQGEELAVLLHSRATGRRAVALARVRQTAGPALTRVCERGDGLAAVVFRLEDSSPGSGLTVDKVAVLAADQDAPGLAHGTAVRVGVFAEAEREFAAARGLSYEAARRSHAAALARFWEDADVEVEGDEEAQLALRYALWSTRIAAPEDGGASSLGAKNLSGDWYRGAVFWDLEMFQLPLLAAVVPARARNHVLYRARRLNAARTLAAQDGYQGARFPWQSYGSGLEEPPVFGGFLYQQQHLNTAVAWGVLHYYALTRDTGLLLSHGLELLLELCRFWASRVSGPDPAGHYHVLNVCGPDEVHQGVDDNAYTNRMVIHVLRETARVLEELSAAEGARVGELLHRLGVDEAARARWQHVAEHLHVPRLPGSAAFAQFAGFEGYPEPDERLRHEQGPGKDKTNKQADALLLFQALPEEFSAAELAACWREYAPLCNQTSSLSLCTHALLAARQGLARDARRFFSAAAGVDLRDGLGNTCAGIHAAGEGGVWLAAVHGFGGLSIGGRAVAIRPALPPFWKGLRYRFFHAGQRLEVRVGPREFGVTNQGRQPVRLELAGRMVELTPGPEAVFPHEHPWREQGLDGVVFSLGVLLTNAARLRDPTAKDAGALTPREVRPGARELLAGLRRAGVRLGVASDCGCAVRALEESGLREAVDAVCDGNNTDAVTPDPQAFHLAAQRLRALPWDCVGVAETAAGVQAIQGAGMAAVGLGKEAADADQRVDALTELTPEALQRVFREHENPRDPYYERNVHKLKSEMA